MVGVGAAQRLDDGLLRRVVDFGDEIVVLLASDLELLEVEAGASDDPSGAARGPDRDGEHRVHGRAWRKTRYFTVTGAAGIAARL